MRPKGTIAELEHRRWLAVALFQQGMKRAEVAQAVGERRWHPFTRWQLDRAAARGGGNPAPGCHPAWVRQRPVDPVARGGGHPGEIRSSVPTRIRLVRAVVAGAQGGGTPQPPAPADRPTEKTPQATYPCMRCIFCA